MSARHACNNCTALQVRQEQAGLLSQPQEKTEMIRFKGRLMPYDDYVRDHLRRPYDEPAESRDARRAAIFEAVEQQGWTVRWGCCMAVLAGVAVLWALVPILLSLLRLHANHLQESEAGLLFVVCLPSGSQL